jgi:hypothetical protein
VRTHDSRGRHTTTHRELLRLPRARSSSTPPGLRELQLWAAPDALEGTFADVDALAAACRFADCAHAEEPGCAVTAAAAAGTSAPRASRAIASSSGSCGTSPCARTSADSASRSSAGRRSTRRPGITVRVSEPAPARALA